MCDRWLKSFATFFADMGPRPSSSHTMERKEVNGHYQPSNCCWATRRNQANNTRVNRRLTLDGVTMTLAQWAEHKGIPSTRLARRLKLGWSLRNALSKPVRPTNRIFTHNGVSKTLPEWAKKVGMPVKRLQYRLQIGWSFEKVILTPGRREDYISYKRYLVNPRTRLWHSPSRQNWSAPGTARCQRWRSPGCGAGCWDQD